MPYIKDEDKTKVALDGAGTPGELNYSFTTIALDYLERKGKNYTHINDVLGALEGCKLELYRRVVVPYENGKLEENGDVF